jgi:HAE1 family hydrophobic/amphiphilic exporter-1
VSRLTDFSVKQTVLVNVLFLVCVVGGLRALQLTEVEYFHDITTNEVSIVTIWNGASAEEVELLVTAKLEEELKTLDDVEEMRSSSQPNVSMIAIEFDENLDAIGLEAAVNETRSALDRASDLPSDAEEPILEIERSSNWSPVVMVAVTDTGDVGELAIRDLAQEAASRMREIQGVSRVEVRGLQDREVRIIVDNARASAYGLTVADIADRVRRQNQNLPAGTFVDAAGEATLRATGDYTSIEQILETVVREDPGGSRVLLRDVARVERGLEKEVYQTRYNGRSGAVLSVNKKDNADVSQVSERVDVWLDEFQPLVPDGISMEKTMDGADFMEPRVNVLIYNTFTGAVLVLALLWFTIGFRNALLTMIAVPFAFLTAIMFFPLLDISINSYTLIGMLLVSGMLVDDAIIVLENIYRKIEAGESLREAVVNGTNEVFWPVVAAVSTSVAAFAPLLMVGGTMGKFISVLPKAVVVCLIASLFECLIILPAHYLEFGSRRGAGQRPDAPGRNRLTQALDALHVSVDRGFDRVRDLYLAALDRVISHRFSFIVLFLSLLVASAAGSTRLAFELWSDEFSHFTINLETPSHYGLERTASVVDELEAHLTAMPDDTIADFNTTIGMTFDLNYDMISAPNLAMIMVEIAENEANRVAPERVLATIRAELEDFRESRPNDVKELRADADRNGPPIGRPVEVRVQSENYALNKSISEEIQAYLRTVPGVSGVDDSLKEGPREIRLLLDDERAAAFGLTFDDVARALRGANDGIVASSYRSTEAVEDDDIRVLLEPHQRDGIHDLLEVDVRSPSGALVKLGDVAQIEVTRGHLAYRRFDAKRAVTVFADVDDDLATSVSVNRDVQSEFAAIETRHPEVDLVFGGEFQESNESMAATAAVFPVALLLIYMILAALFRSYLQPLIVITSIPVGFAGIIFGVGILGYAISFNLMYAMVGLAGVVVNDALVMVDFINRARREGMALSEAIRQAGAQRLRPVVLTTLTTVIALLPMALGIAGESKTYGPFAASIAFGLLFAMIGTLFVVPLSYSTLITGQQAGARLLQGWRAGRSPEGPNVAPPEAP